MIKGCFIRDCDDMFMFVEELQEDVEVGPALEVHNKVIYKFGRVMGRTLMIFLKLAHLR